jgi:hypothetical protein
MYKGAHVAHARSLIGSIRASCSAYGCPSAIPSPPPLFFIGVVQFRLESHHAASEASERFLLFFGGQILQLKILSSEI